MGTLLFFIAYYVWSIVYWYKKIIGVPMNILRSTENMEEALTKIRQSGKIHDHATPSYKRDGDSTREEIGWDLILAEVGPWFLYCLVTSPFMVVCCFFNSKTVTGSLFGYRPTVGSDDRVHVSAEDYKLFKKFKEQK